MRIVINNEIKKLMSSLSWEDCFFLALSRGEETLAEGNKVTTSAMMQERKEQRKEEAEQ